MRIYIFLAVSIISLLFYAPAERSYATALLPTDIVEKQVLLLRHSVRAPTQNSATLAQWARKPWPRWPVPAGELTPRGQELAQRWGAALRERLAAYGLVQAEGCVTPQHIYVRADLDQRTRATAHGLLQGFAPGCGLVFTVSERASDPVFNAVKAGCARYDAQAVQRQLPPQVWSELADALASELHTLHRLSDGLGEKLCARTHAPSASRHAPSATKHAQASCTLADLPTTLRVDAHAVKLHGGLAIASGMAEIFLLEWAQWPGRNPAWNGLDAQSLLRLLQVHSRVFNTLYRAPAVGMPRGGLTLHALEKMLHTTDPLTPRVAIFVGHDTNIAAVSGLLGVHWHSTSYPPNATPPLSALQLSLVRSADGTRSIKAAVLLPTLQALHQDFAPSTQHTLVPASQCFPEGEGRHSQQPPAAPPSPLATFPPTLPPLLPLESIPLPLPHCPPPCTPEDFSRMCRRLAPVVVSSPDAISLGISPP